MSPFLLSIMGPYKYSVLVPHHLQFSVHKKYKSHSFPYKVLASVLPLNNNWLEQVGKFIIIFKTPQLHTTLNN